jgi:dihydrofolate reductase
MISLIAAVAQNGAIGKNNQLLWHLPEDMRYFRETTRGKTVIMGRKTWESLPAAFRPLPGRRNIVVTRDAHYVAEGAVLAHSLPEAIATAGEAGETFVIGGAELYLQALPQAQRLYLTEVAQTCEGDVFFPEIPAAKWQEVSRDEQSSATGIKFAFVVYQPR